MKITKKILFGRFLQKEGLLDREQITRVLEYQRNDDPSMKFGEICLIMGFLSRPQLLRYLALHQAKIFLTEYLDNSILVDAEKLRIIMKNAIDKNQTVNRILAGMSYLTESEAMYFFQERNWKRDINRTYLVDRDHWQKVEEELFGEKSILPIKIEDTSISVLMAGDFFMVAIDDVENFWSQKPNFLEAAADDLRRIVKQVYCSKQLGMSVLGKGRKFVYMQIGEYDLAKEKEDIDVVRIVNFLIQHGLTIGASDLHIEPFENKLRVRFRTDGILKHYTDLPGVIMARLSSRVKILCNLEISEKRRHQDGKIRARIAGEEIDLRVSTYASEFGETIVIRYLPKISENDIDGLGMAPLMFENYKNIIESPSGIVLITGPTGSGKTTSLYASAKYLNRSDKKIITVEDPIEYTIPGTIQGEISERIGIDYTDALKAILRQDPDIIMLGEVRDRASAEATVQAGLTGHKIFTTFHTDDTTGALLRLMDMGIETFLISSTVVSVISQRLVRKICRNCMEEYKPHSSLIKTFKLRDFDIDSFVFYKGKGCTRCDYSGYKGRTGIFELLVLNDAVRNAILSRKTSTQIRKIARDTSDLISMREDGIYKALNGITTPEEVLKMVYHTESDEYTERSIEEIFELLEGPNPKIPYRESINVIADLK